MVKKEIIDLVQERLQSLFHQHSKILAIVLYGSHTKGLDRLQSDIDVCIIAPKANSEKLFNEMLVYNQEPLDIKIFENLPVNVQMEVIDTAIPILVRDELSLSEYFYYRRKICRDDLRRNKLSGEELNYFIERFLERVKNHKKAAEKLASK